MRACAFSLAQLIAYILTEFQYGTIMQSKLSTGDFYMPAMTIKNIPDDLYRELKHIAEQHHRSINSEVIVCLKRTLFPVRISAEDRLNSARALRASIASDIISANEMDHAINEGRP